MRNYAVLVLLVSSLLFFGCLHEAKPAATPTPIVTATPLPTVTGAPTVEPTATPAPTGQPTAVLPASVAIKDYKFSPERLAVKKGATVTWTNQDAVQHSVVRDAGSPGPESQLLGQGQSFSYTFSEKGLYYYHCGPHPYMKATVEVTE